MSRQNKFPKTDVLGVAIDKLTIPQAVDHIVELAPKLRRGDYIVKPYVEFFDREHKDAKFRKALNEAYMCLPDGVALKWAAYYNVHRRHRFWDIITSGLSLITHPHKSSSEIPGHFGGSNFTWHLMERCAEHDLTVFLIGSPKHGTIQTTVNFLKSELPKLRVVGTQTGRDPATGRYSEKLKKELEKTLKSLKPDIVLFGTNFASYIPLMSLLAPRLSHSLLIGEGGTFDYKTFGGRKPKSPIFIQKVGLEWAWRLLLEPSRIRRQMAIPRFIWQVYRRSKA